MKLYDDIRPKKVSAKKPENLQPSHQSSLSGDQLNYSQKENKKSSLNFFRIFSIFFFVLAISFFCLSSVIKIKSKLMVKFAGLDKVFSSFSESLGSLDIPAVSNQLQAINDRSKEAIILLQSVGQDVYCLNLLYPSGQGSKTTMQIDAIRSVHLLTSSFVIISENQDRKPAASGGDYLDKINTIFVSFGNYLFDLPNKLITARILTDSAKSIGTGLDFQRFSTNDQKTLRTLAKMSITSSDFVRYLVSLSPQLNEALAIGSGKKSYLVLFQNNAEIRPGGGFLGSFAKIEIEDGKIQKLDFEKNIYTLDKYWNSQTQKVEPPEEYKQSFVSVAMRDANYYPDFAQSSKNVIDFYQKESGTNVDGIVAIDTTLFRNLLKVVGPIEMKEYNITVTDKNFLSDVQYQVEKAYFATDEGKKENQPKKILADMMPKMVSGLFATDDKKKLAGQEIFKAIKQKHLLFYFKDQKVEDLIDGIGASGKIKEFDGDYIFVSESNIGGLKSSLNISRVLNQKVVINSNGSLLEELDLLRKHTASGVWPDGVNKNFTKLFLPLGAKMSEVKFISGNNDGAGNRLEPKVEYNKNQVSFWQTTDPGKDSQTKVTYERKISLEGKNSFEYSILIQKQPGVEKFDWNLYLVYPEGWKPQNVENYDSAKRQISLKETILADSVFRLRFIRD